MAKVKASYIPQKYDWFWDEMINKYERRILYILNLQLKSGTQLLPKVDY